MRRSCRDTLEFDCTIAVAKAFATHNPNTLVLQAAWTTDVVAPTA
jgi:hypothetical protein